MIDILETLGQALSYKFMVKALLGGILLGLASSFLGSFLVLKKYSMIGDGLAHVSLFTVALGFLLGTSPILISIPLVVLSSIIILYLDQNENIDGDGAIGIISSLAMALGVLISSKSQGFNIDLFSYLFGSILLISDFEIILSLLLAGLVVGLIIKNYHILIAISYDEHYAKSLGLSTKKYNYLLGVLTSVTIVLGIRIVGTMLVSSLIVLPTITALQVARSFKTTIIIANLVSVSSVIIGVISSYLLDFPTGASIVLINGLYFIAFMAYKKIILE